MDACIQQCRYLILLADSLLEGIDDAHIAIEPQPGLKTAGWLVGHLTTTADFGRHLCGRKAICPREWRALFTPGTQPSTDASTAGEFVAYMMSGHLAYHVGQISAWRAAAGIARSGRPDNLAA